MLKFKLRSTQRKTAQAGLHGDFCLRHDGLREPKRGSLVVLQNGVWCFCYSYSPVVSKAVGGQRCRACRGCERQIRDAASWVPVTHAE